MKALQWMVALGAVLVLIAGTAPAQGPSVRTRNLLAAAGEDPDERPGRPVGAEAQCLRLAYRLVRQRFG